MSGKNRKGLVHSTKRLDNRVCNQDLQPLEVFLFCLVYRMQFIEGEVFFTGQVDSYLFQKKQGKRNGSDQSDQTVIAQFRLETKTEMK